MLTFTIVSIISIKCIYKRYFHILFERLVWSCCI